MVFPTAVMRFMGDAPLKGQSELDVLCTLLKVSPASARCSLPCPVARFPLCHTELQDFGVGSFLHGPKRSASHWWEGLGTGYQACRQVPTLFLCAWYVACDLACPPTAVWGP